VIGIPRQRISSGLGVLLCFVAGALIAGPMADAVEVVLALVVAAVGVGVVLRFGRIDLLGLLVLGLFGGYLILNRNFAELHLPFGSLPIYVGEVVLILALPWAFTREADWRTVINQPFFMALFAWQAYCAGRLLAGGLAYGVDALRDSAIWYYGFFAVVGFTLWPRVPRRTWMAFFGVSFMALIGVSLVYAIKGPPSIPIPWSDPTLPVKVDRADVMSVGLVASATFFLLAIPGRAWFLGRVLLAAVCLGLLLPLEVRAASVGFALLFVILIAQGRWRAVVPLAVLPVAAVAVVLVFGVPLAGRYASDSSGGLVARQLSTLSAVFEGQATSSDPTVDTAAWRVAWWSALIKETSGEPQSIITGLGFGTDLTAPLEAQFGVQVDDTGRPVRSPHNFLITLFARTGIIGLGLWGLAQCLWMGSVFSAVRRARAAGLDEDADLLLWMAGYVLLILVAATLGVVLEGPYGAIPYYLLMGMSLRFAHDILLRAKVPPRVFPWAVPQLTPLRDSRG
jgi:hypothetical protein